jgi:hypothetical protein
MAEQETAGKPMAELVKDLEEIVIGRLEEIEAGHRRLKQLGGIAALLLVALILALGATLYTSYRAGYLGGAAASVRAREFVLTDGAGAVRGTWALLEDGSTRFFMQDRDGVPRLKLTVLDGGAPGLSFTDESGRSRVVLGLLPDETSTLVFADRTGEARAVLGLSAEEAASLVFVDRAGSVRAGLGVAADGSASLTIPDEPPPLPPQGSN